MPHSIPAISVLSEYSIHSVVKTHKLSTTAAVLGDPRLPNFSTPLTYSSGSPLNIHRRTKSRSPNLQSQTLRLRPLVSQA